MKPLLLFLSLLYCQIGLSQNHKGIAFQAVARTSYGVIMPNKLIQIRISIQKQRFKSVRHNESNPNK